MLNVRFFSSVFFVITLIHPASVFPTSDDFSVEPDLESALLKEDWSKVAQVLEAKEVPSVPEQFLKAHAQLALNRTTESLCGFVKMENDKDITAWNNWTAGFLTGHPKETVALYLRGDSLARHKKWDAALLLFDKALKSNQENALVLNARGVVNARIGQWDNSLLDFDVLTRKKSDFADGHASLGALWVHMNSGPRGALAAFDRALQIDSDFVLAHNGRAAALYALGDWEEAIEELKRAVRGRECIDIPEKNAVRVAESVEEISKKMEQRVAQLTPGMPLEARTRYIGSLDRPAAVRDYAQADANRRWSQGGVALGKALQGIPATRDLGRHIESTSRSDVKYWRNWTNDIGKTHEIEAMRPQGVSSEDLRMSFIDEGNWLRTSFTLRY